MKFIFDCSTRYLSSERSEGVIYRVEHEKRNFISPSNHVLFCLFYKTTHNEVFRRFPTIFKKCLVVKECFLTFSGDCRGRSEDVST